MTALDAGLEVLAARFAARVPSLRDQLRAALAAGDNTALRQISHRLAGSAALFNAQAVGTAARQLEEQLIAATEIAQAFAALDAALSAITGSSGEGNA